MTALRACAIIPVFDHAATVGEVVRGAAEHLPLVIVVDDGSGDGSGDRAQAASAGLPPEREVEVLRLPSNRGKGAALLEGFRRAADRGFTHAVALDADGQHLPADVPKFLDAARAHPGAILVGVRDLTSPCVPMGSRIGRWISNFWTLRTTGHDLADTQCGFRCYPLAGVLALPLRARRYDFEVEVLVRGAWAGLDPVEVPIDVWYPKREERVSHFRGIVDNVRISWTYTRLALRRLWPAGRGLGHQLPKAAPGPRGVWKAIRGLVGEGTRPSELALATSAGVFVGATPLWGLHTFLALYVAARLRLNPVAALLGSNISNPFFAPYLVFGSIQVGHFLCTGALLPLSAEGMAPARIPEYLRDYLVGALPVAGVLSLLTGIVVLVFASLVAPGGREAGKGTIRRRPFLSAMIYLWLLILLMSHGLLCLLVLPWTLLFDRNRRVAARLTAAFARAALRHFRCTGEAFAVLAAVDIRRPAVIVMNHRSIVDIGLAVSLPGGPRMAAKAWVGRVPLLGWSLFLSGHECFDPSNPRSGMRMMERMEAHLRKGISVIVFPEGTRGSGPGMGEFRRGAFRLAVRTGTDILPIVLHGTGDVVPPGALLFTSARATAEVLKRIPAGSDEDALCGRVRREMLSALGRPRSP